MSAEQEKELSVATADGRLCENTSTNVPTHMVWAGRWIPATRVKVEGEDGWRFANGRDAADWLRYPDTQEPRPSGDTKNAARTDLR